jgi:hypothetical protein
LNINYRIKLKNKHLTPVGDGQFDPADCGQGRWLFQLENLDRLKKVVSLC